MSRFRIITLAVLALLLLIVILQNTAAVETRLLFVTVTMPRAVLLIVTLLAGFAPGIVSAAAVGRHTRGQ